MNYLNKIVDIPLYTIISNLSCLDCYYLSCVSKIMSKTFTDDFWKQMCVFQKCLQEQSPNSTSRTKKFKIPDINLNWRKIYFLRILSPLRMLSPRRLLRYGVEEQDYDAINLAVAMNPQIISMIKNPSSWNYYGCYMTNYEDGKKFLALPHMANYMLESSVIYMILIHLIKFDSLTIKCFMEHEKFRNILLSSSNLPRSMKKLYTYSRLEPANLSKYIKIACMFNSVNVLEYLLKVIPQKGSTLVSYIPYLISPLSGGYYSFKKCLQIIVQHHKFNGRYIDKYYLKNLLRHYDQWYHRDKLIKLVLSVSHYLKPCLVSKMVKELEERTRGERGIW